jgi:hypothetical protein
MHFGPDQREPSAEKISRGGARSDRRGQAGSVDAERFLVSVEHPKVVGSHVDPAKGGK